MPRQSQVEAIKEKDMSNMDLQEKGIGMLMYARVGRRALFLMVYFLSFVIRRIQCIQLGVDIVSIGLNVAPES